VPTDPARVQTIFLAAAALSDPAARVEYLDQECGEDAHLRARVEALLRAHDQPDSLLDSADPAPSSDLTRTAPPDAGETHTHNDAAADDLADALAVLDPAGRPDSLGRIGHYEVLEVLGRGGFGIVYRAFDDVLQRVVAIKMLAPSLATTSPARKRFLREARSSAKVRHENVVQIYQTVEEPLPYLVMEFIPGETLQQRLDRTGPLDVSEVLRIGRQIASGLAAAHETGLIHRDIKPSNILIGGDPQAHVKITDFGLARAADDASLTRSGAVAGTPMYMAPEQANGEALDHRADLFSLGSVVYTMLTGRPPFRAGNTPAVLKRVAQDNPRPIREVIPEVPRWLCRIVDKLHAKKPANRFQSAGEVADLLADCEAQLKSQGDLKDQSRIPGSNPVRPDKPAPRRRNIWVVLVVILVVIVLGLPVILMIGAALFWFVLGAEPSQPNNGPPVMDVMEAHDRGTMQLVDFVPLFNGKNLKGWAPADGWKVEDGELVGRGNGRPALLISQRDDYENYQLRFDMKMTGNPPSSSTIFARWTSDQSGYGVVYNASDSSLTHYKTGNEPTLSDSHFDNLPVPPADTWMRVEVISNGSDFAVNVNGKPHSRAKGAIPRGRIALLASPGAVVHFQRMEIKELPSGPPPAEGLAPLFNSKDLTGWTSTEGSWKVEGGELVGQANKLPALLFSQRDDFENYHLHFETKVVHDSSFSSAIFARWKSSRDAYGIAYNADSQTVTLYQAGLDRTLSESRFENPPIPAADTWFTVDITSKGPDLAVFIDGKLHSRATGSIPRGRIALLASPGAVVRYRKFEIKELPPTNPPPGGPFALSAPNGKSGQTFATLAEAIAAAPANGIVEIRDNGPFPMNGVRIEQPLTIRAGAGYRPVLDHDKADGLNPALIGSSQNLVLEGLELRGGGGPEGKPRILVNVVDGQLSAANCRFMSAWALTRAVRSPRVDFRNCELVSGWNMAAAINWTDPPSKGVLRMENCVTPNWCLFLSPSQNELDGIDIEFRNNTFAQQYLLSCYSGGELLGDGKRPPPFRVTAVNNVLQSENLFRIEMNPAQTKLADWPLDRVDKLGRAVLSWKGDGNVYLPTSGYDLWHGVAQPPARRTAKTRADWKAGWGVNDANSTEAVVRFRGPVRQKATGAPQSLTADDFRLADNSPDKGAGPGGKDRGVDTNLVGPGPAYERWKKSAEYLKWAAEVSRSKP
jgi:serine/threonine protein kinase